MIGLCLALAHTAQAQARLPAPVPLPDSDAAHEPYVVHGRHRRTWLDLELRVGGGLTTGPGRTRGTGALRLRPALVHQRNRSQWSLGASWEITAVSPATFGIQLGALHTVMPTLLFGQLGALIDIDGTPGLTVAGGWGAVGLEAAVRIGAEAGPTTTLLLHLTVPYRQMSEEFSGPGRVE